MTETTIFPQATYTRAQAAKIITTMVLGVNGAKSCVASYAPFDDVAANHWAAGYIAFCKEQGIIDGVTDTTFDPEGTLTGYQWAKMLLAAVGFNANNELEGSSWSLNTARIGREGGLFDGDLAGADHTPLRREQAMLYAFNTLSGIKQVTYSANATNYVYGIKGYVFADGTGYTLGEKVFKLAKVEGQIIDNEGMGNANTVVDNVAYTGKWGSPAHYIAVDANTGLDLMYHAVRVWYVDGKTNTNVYVCDLAKTTVYECMNMATGLKEYNKLTGTKGTETIGTGTAYESYLIDNTALDLGHEYVTLNANYGKMGFKGTNNTTIVNNDGDVNNSVKNSLILTDISDIEYGDGIIYVVASSTQDTSDKAWHVWATSATSGAVKSFKQSDGVVISVTLTDDTVLEMSSFWKKYGTIPTGEIATGRNYNFILDTHGDVIAATADYARDLYAYTGEYRNTGSYNDINTDRGFINVSTGEERWASVVGGARYLFWGTYYDLSASTTSNGLYVATRVTSRSNPYTEHFAIGHFVFNSKSTGTTYATSNGDERVYFDGSSITFYVAEGFGENMTVTPYTGIAALKTALGVASNGTVELDNAVFTVVDTYSGDSKYATVCFVFKEDVSTQSNYVFVPYDISKDDWDEVTGDPLGYTVSYNGAWLEGKEVVITFDPTDINIMTDGNGNVLTRGFYTVSTTYNRNGVTYYAVDRKVANGTAAGGIDELCFYTDVKVSATDPTGGAPWVFNAKYTTDADTVVVQFIDEASVTSLAALWQLQDSGIKFSYAFTVDPNDNHVDYVYAVADGWLNDVDVLVDEDLADLKWTATGELNDVDYGVKDEFVVTLSNSELASKLTVGATYKVTYDVDRLDSDGNSMGNAGHGKIATATVQNDGTLTFTAEVWPQEHQTIKVTVTDIEAKLNVYNMNTANYSDVYVNGVAYTLGETVQLAATRNDEFDMTGTSAYPTGPVKVVVGTYNEEAQNEPIMGTIDSDRVTVEWTWTLVNPTTTLYFYGVTK